MTLTRTSARGIPPPRYEDERDVLLAFDFSDIGWAVDSVTDMSSMFVDAASFNSDISGGRSTVSGMKARCLRYRRQL